MASGGGIGQNWVNGLEYAKFDFWQDGSNFRPLRGFRTDILGIWDLLWGLGLQPGSQVEKSAKI